MADSGGWNPSSCETRTSLYYIVNIMDADDPVLQGAMTSAAMVLTQFIKEIMLA